MDEPYHMKKRTEAVTGAKGAQGVTGRIDRIAVVRPVSGRNSTRDEASNCSVRDDGATPEGNELLRTIEMAGEPV